MSAPRASLSHLSPKRLVPDAWGAFSRAAGPDAQPAYPAYPDARNPHAFPELIREGFEPHTVSQVWVGGASPTMVVDITKTFD